MASAILHGPGIAYVMGHQAAIGSNARARPGGAPRPAPAGLKIKAGDAVADIGAAPVLHATPRQLVATRDSLCRRNPAGMLDLLTTKWLS